MRHLLLLLAPVALLAQQQALPPWTDPFAGSPQAILNAAAAVSSASDDEAIVLLDERHYEIQKDGRLTSTARKVFRLLAQDAVDDWSTVEQNWQPWHQSKPAIRARVITADGVEHVLDPKTIADAPASEWEANVFSDIRVVRAPLPALAKGAVVEYQITTEDIAPLFAAGISPRTTTPHNNSPPCWQCTTTILRPLANGLNNRPKPATRIPYPTRRSAHGTRFWPIRLWWCRLGIRL